MQNNFDLTRVAEDVLVSSHDHLRRTHNYVMEYVLDNYIHHDKRITDEWFQLVMDALQAAMINGEKQLTNAYSVAINMSFAVIYDKYGPKHALEPSTEQWVVDGLDAHDRCIALLNRQHTNSMNNNHPRPSHYPPSHVQPAVHDTSTRVPYNNRQNVGTRTSPTYNSSRTTHQSHAYGQQPTHSSNKYDTHQTSNTQTRESPVRESEPRTRHGRRDNVVDMSSRRESTMVEWEHSKLTEYLAIKSNETRVVDLRRVKFGTDGMTYIPTRKTDVETYEEHELSRVKHIGYDGVAPISELVTGTVKRDPKVKREKKIKVTKPLPPIDKNYYPDEGITHFSGYTLPSVVNGVSSHTENMYNILEVPVDLYTELLGSSSVFEKVNMLLGLESDRTHSVDCLLKEYLTLLSELLTIVVCMKVGLVLDGGSIVVSITSDNKTEVTKIKSIDELLHELATKLPVAHSQFMNAADDYVTGALDIMPEVSTEPEEFAIITQSRVVTKGKTTTHLLCVRRKVVVFIAPGHLNTTANYTFGDAPLELSAELTPEFHETAHKIMGVAIKAMPGAVVLISDTYGHCLRLASMPVPMAKIVVSQVKLV